MCWCCIPLSSVHTWISFSVINIKPCLKMSWAGVFCAESFTFSFFSLHFLGKTVRSERKTLFVDPIVFATDTHGKMLANIHIHMVFLQLTQFSSWSLIDTCTTFSIVWLFYFVYIFNISTPSTRSNRAEWWKNGPKRNFACELNCSSKHVISSSNFHLLVNHLAVAAVGYFTSMCMCTVRVCACDLKDLWTAIPLYTF